jgi:hypothetical protein
MTVNVEMTGSGGWREQMAFISVTRLRVRSFFLLPQFMWGAIRTANQARRSNGFLDGKLVRMSRNVFWTVTAWETEAAMNAYRIAGAHLLAMPKLLRWCDEAAVAHWSQDSAELPSWQEAHRRMVTEGRLSKVNHPSPAQVANHIPAPEPSRTERRLRVGVNR